MIGKLLIRLVRYKAFIMEIWRSKKWTMSRVQITTLGKDETIDVPAMIQKTIADIYL